MENISDLYTDITGDLLFQTSKLNYAINPKNLVLIAQASKLEAQEISLKEIQNIVIRISIDAMKLLSKLDDECPIFDTVKLMGEDFSYELDIITEITKVYYKHYKIFEFFPKSVQK